MAEVGSFTELPPTEPFKRINVQIGVSTQASPKHPDRNEDTPLAREEHSISGVADGVGGTSHGDIASALLMDDLERTLDDQEAITSSDDFFDVVQEGIRRHREEIAGFGDADTTLTAGMPFEQNGQRMLALVHSGDSRAYALLRNGHIQLLSKDHNITNEVFAKYPEIAAFINHAIDTADTANDLFTQQNTQKLQKLWAMVTDKEDRKRIPKYIQELLAKNKIYATITEPRLDQFWLARNVIMHGVRGGVDIQVIPLPEDCIGALYVTDGGTDTLSQGMLEASYRHIDLDGDFAQPLADAIVETTMKTFADPAKQNPPGSARFRTKPDDVTAVVTKFTT